MLAFAIIIPRRLKSAACQGDPETPAGKERYMNRNKKITVRLSDDEHAFLKANIEKSGLSQEAYLRIIISGRIPKERPGEPLIKMVRELAAIGNNIHQLSVKANALGFIDTPKLETEMREWREFRLAVKRHFLEPDKAGDVPSP
jgi:hypothetical protein